MVQQQTESDSGNQQVYLFRTISPRFTETVGGEEEKTTWTVNRRADEGLAAEQKEWPCVDAMSVRVKKKGSREKNGNERKRDSLASVLDL